MTRSKLTAQRLAALFLAGWMVFNYPLLSLFNLPHTVLGIPLLYVYVFAAWAIMIGFMAWLVERRKD
ncbi:MAG: hypothetical protein JNJ60_10665 [Rhodocyclaceae bacterium]|nr:hypothetical protein [Rhodocyclaceae bacterium]